MQPNHIPNNNYSGGSPLSLTFIFFSFRKGAPTEILDVRDRIDDLEAEVKRLGANTNDNEDEEEKLAEIKKDVDFIMGRGDPEADAISGIPTLVRN